MFMGLVGKVIGMLHAMTAGALRHPLPHHAPYASTPNLIMQQGLVNERPEVGEAGWVAQAGALSQFLLVLPQPAGGQHTQFVLGHLGLQQLGGFSQVLL